MEIKGYKIVETLHMGRLFTVYRALREEDQTWVILKTWRAEEPDLQDITTLQHEYQLLQQFNHPLIIKAQDLLKDKYRFVLALEDAPGIPLKSYLSQGPLSVEDFLKVGIQLAEGLQIIHLKQIIHKDLNPHNILIDSETKAIKILDFSISSQLSQSSQQSLETQNLEGTLHYMAPEQTGRVNRPMDYRVDFYALGVTFYEMLSGQLPFVSEDPLELIYQHLTKDPPALKDVPEILSVLICKLMAKMPEKRYASALGLKADLEECLKQWKDKKSIKTFPLAQHDVYGQLVISHKLYGREKQAQKLLHAFELVSQGNNEILFVSGYSGVGKTSLVKEVYKPITRQRGYFVSGKYDQLRRTTPYSGLIEAFQDLMRRLLAEPPDRLQIIKDRLLQALGPNGQVIIDIIPSVALVIGPQPPLPAFSPQETQNRFTLTFQNFVQALAQADHPLVLFLDDLQWADTASLSLLKVILSDKSIQHLFIIGAYRDNEVEADHPLVLLQEDLKKSGLVLHDISLKPLLEKDVQNLLSDTLNSTETKVAPLARLLLNKTHGNPYFINEIFKKLYQEEALVFSHDSLQWEWNIEAIEKQKITDNVVDLLLDRIRELPEHTQTALKIAACIGHTFELKTLALLNSQTSVQTAEHLWEATRLNLVAPVGENALLAEHLAEGIAVETFAKLTYVFSHDRIQQAAYALIEADQRAATHLAIGRLYTQESPLKENDERLFEVLDHFNQALPLIEDEAEKLMLAHANLWAGKKAKVATAYQIANHYLDTGLSLTSGRIWEDHYYLAFSLYKEFGECQFLGGDFEKAEASFQDLLKHTRTELDKVEAYKIKMLVMHALNKHLDVIQLGKKALHLLGLKLPERPSKLDFLKLLLKIQWKVGFKESSFRLNLIPVEDEKIKETMVLLLQMMPSAYVLADQNLYSIIIPWLVLLTLKNGYTSESPYGFLAYGFILMHILKWYRKALWFIEEGIKIRKSVKDSPFTPPESLLLGHLLLTWRDPLDQCTPYLLTGYQRALERGDITYANYIMVAYLVDLHILGLPMRELVKTIQGFFAFKEKFKLNNYTTIVENLNQCNQYLQEDSYKEEIFTTKLNYLQEMISQVKSNPLASIPIPDIGPVCSLWQQVFYILGRFKDAVTLLELREPYKEGHLSTLLYMEGEFYHALALTGLYPSASPSEKKVYAKKIKSLHSSFKQWLEWCPATFKPYETILAAERENLEGDIPKAMDLYNQAVHAAEENNALHLIGIANECAGRFYLRLKQPPIAQPYFQKAHYAFSRWGARAKADQLEKQYPEWFHAAPQTREVSSLTATLSPYTSIASIDLLAVMKSTSLISSEIRLDKLLEKLLVLLLQDSGAEQGTLIMQEKGEWFVKAQGTAERQTITLTQDAPLKGREDLPLALLSLTERTQEKILLQSPAELEPYFLQDPYLAEHKPGSVLILPLTYQGNLKSLLYLENKSTPHAFTPAHVQSLELLASQAAISLENAGLYYQATHDSLTGLANRTFLYTAFDQAVSRAKRSRQFLAVMFLDLDKFKTINDTLGHEVGDKALMCFSDQLQSCLRDTDLAARLGGDEFVALVESVHDKSQLQALAERILKGLNKEVSLLGHDVKLGASIGISLYPQDGEDIQELLKKADMALYQAKEQGRGQYKFYGPFKRVNPK